MKRLIFTSVFVMFALQLVWCQQLENLAFVEKIHDFGTIQEVDGPVEFAFEFTNKSGAPVKILNVKASCGCTTPGWTKEDIGVGEEGFVKAKYDPQNRPGSFNKSLTVTTNDATARYILYIRGNVVPKPRTIEDDLPTLMGGIRVKYRAFNMGKVLNKGPVTSSFDVYNASEQPITFLDSIKAPSYITVSVEPVKLNPKEKGKINITYDAKARGDLGFMSDNIVLFTDEEEENQKSFSVYANIEEYFPPMTAEELAQAPKLEFGKNIHDFGKIKQGEVVKTEFLFTNTGKSDLNIRKTKSTCGCTVSKPEKETLAPGESAKIVVSFNSAGRRGAQQKAVTVFSNDPKAPTQRITIKAFIEE